MSRVFQSTNTCSNTFSQIYNKRNLNYWLCPKHRWFFLLHGSYCHGEPQPQGYPDVQEHCLPCWLAIRWVSAWQGKNFYVLQCNFVYISCDFSHLKNKCLPWPDFPLSSPTLCWCSHLKSKLYRKSCLDFSLIPILHS